MTNICYTISDESKTEYKKIENKCHAKYNRRCIDGSITGCGNCVGYCKFSEHPGFLTQKHREQHDCVNKKCFYYVPKPKTKHIFNDKNFETDLLKLAQKSVEGMDDLRIVNVRKKGDTWFVGYITVFGGHILLEIEDVLRQNIGVPIVMQKLDYSFDRCVELLLK